MISRTFDRTTTSWLRRWAVPLLRVALGVVFLWFGALKVFGVSPVTSLIHETYTFFPTGPFVLVLGVWEMIIGVGLLMKRCLRTTLVLLWLQMLGTFFSLALDPQLFFAHGNFFILTADGEFVIKNLVLISASMVVWGYEATDIYYSRRTLIE